MSALRDRLRRRFLPLLAVLWVACHGASAMAAASFEATRAAHTPSETQVVDRHGELLQRCLLYTSWAQFSVALAAGLPGAMGSGEIAHWCCSMTFETI